MSRALRAGLLAVVVAAAAASPASADETYVDPCADETVVEAGPLYAAYGDSGTWLYRESNGIPGLQRGSVTPLGAEHGGDDSGCRAYYVDRDTGARRWAFTVLDTAIF